MYPKYILSIMLVPLIICSCEIPTSSKEAPAITEDVIYIPGREPEFEEVLQLVEANEEAFLHLFPSFHHDNNRLKLCCVNRLGVDHYYLKDEQGHCYKIGEAYNWHFRHNYPDTIPDSTEIIANPKSYDRCSLLNL